MASPMVPPTTHPRVRFDSWGIRYPVQMLSRKHRCMQTRYLKCLHAHARNAPLRPHHANKTIADYGANVPVVIALVLYSLMVAAEQCCSFFAASI